MNDPRFDPTDLTMNALAVDDAVARQSVAWFVDRYGAQADDYRLLACYAAMPLVLTPELLNYLHNRFLADAGLPWVAEVDLLLSDLVHPVVDDLYAMPPATRAYLLAELRQRVGDAKLANVARVLIHYTRRLASANSALDDEELRAQQWAAMVYLDELRPTAVREVAQAFRAVADQLHAQPASAPFDMQRAEFARLAHITQLLAPQIQAHVELVEYAKLVSRLLAGETVDGAPTSVQVAGTTLTVPDVLLKRPWLPSPEKIGFEWVTVPAGEFTMGSNDSSDEKPIHRVHLSAYQIARHPVTNAQYELFVKTTSYAAPRHWENGKIPAGKENHPVMNVSWQDAQAFCGWAGVRLPTEAEWEKAARGTEERKYPWGNEPPTKELCNFGNLVGDTTPVGRYPKGASPYGVLDMAGNVWEWVSDWYDKKYYSVSPGSNPQGPATGKYRVLRGGSLNNNDGNVRSAFRNYLVNPDLRLNLVGFRCVRSL
jgi:formylglycine-generating enzyme required for sulfatase activity